MGNPTSWPAFDGSGTLPYGNSIALAQTAQVAENMAVSWPRVLANWETLLEAEPNSALWWSNALVNWSNLSEAQQNIVWEFTRTLDNWANMTEDQQNAALDVFENDVNLAARFPSPDLAATPLDEYYDNIVTWLPVNAQPPNLFIPGISGTDQTAVEGSAFMTDFGPLGTSMGSFGLVDLFTAPVGLALTLSQLSDQPVASPASNPNYNPAGVTYGQVFSYSLQSGPSFLPGINSPFDPQPTVAQQVLSAYGVQWNFSEGASSVPNLWDINVMPSSLVGTGAAQYLANANNPFINNAVTLPFGLSADSDITPVANWQADPMYLWSLGYDPVYQAGQPTVVNVVGSMGTDDMAPLLFSEPDYTPSDYQLSELPLTNQGDPSSFYYEPSAQPQASSDTGNSPSQVQSNSSFDASNTTPPSSLGQTIQSINSQYGQGQVDESGNDLFDAMGALMGTPPNFEVEPEGIYGQPTIVNMSPSSSVAGILGNAVDMEYYYTALSQQRQQMAIQTGTIGV